MIAAIVCVDNNFGIGYNGDLLAHIPEDIKFFREKKNLQAQMVLLVNPTKH